MESEFRQTGLISSTDNRGRQVHHSTRGLTLMRLTFSLYFTQKNVKLVIFYRTGSVSLFQKVSFPCENKPALIRSWLVFFPALGR